MLARTGHSVMFAEPNDRPLRYLAPGVCNERNSFARSGFFVAE
jgi:hypothetical protein